MVNLLFIFFEKHRNSLRNEQTISQTKYPSFNTTKEKIILTMGNTKEFLH